MIALLDRRIKRVHIDQANDYEHAGILTNPATWQKDELGGKILSEE